MSKITRFIKKYYHILFFLFLSSWILLYQQGGIISIGDFTFPVKPVRALNIRLFAWKEFGPLGHSSTIDFVNIIYYLPIFLLNKIGFSISFVQSLFFIFLFFTASYFTYLLLFEILGSCKYKKLIAIISANFYIFNPYVFVLKLQGYDISLYAYSFTPLILYLFYKYLKTKNCFRNKYLYLLGLCFLLSVPSNTQPVYTTWTVFILFFYLSFLFLSGKFDRTVLYKSFITVSVFFLINSFWLIPSLSSGMFTDIFNVTRDATNLDILVSTSGQKLIEVFRFLGIDAFTESWRGIPYFSYHRIYYTPIFIIISFILLGIGLSFWLFRTRDKRDKFWGNYFFSIFLISIFFIGGTNFLFPNFKQWLFENFSVMLLYRKPYEKIGFFLIFSFAGLLAFSLKNIVVFLENRLDKYKKKIIVGFLLSLLLLINIYSFPFWTKQIFLSYKYSECKITSLVQYPNYYHEFEEYFEGDKKIGRILGLPANRSPIVTGVENYEWGYSGLDPIYNFINSEYILINPLMTFFKSFYKDINSDLTDSNNYGNNLINLTKLLSIKKIILRNDICWRLYGSPNPEQDKEYLQGFFAKTISLGKLDVFDVPKDYFLPHFYIPQNIIYSTGGIENLEDVVGLPEYQIRSGIYFGNAKRKTQNAKLGNSEVLERADKVVVEGRLENRVDEKYFEKLETFKNGVPFPYVRQKLGSWGWKLARIQEQFEEWKVRKEPEKLIEKKLYYAGKRISEEEKFQIPNFKFQINPKSKISNLESELWKQKMEEAIGEVKRYRDLEPEKAKEQVIKIRAYWERHKEEIERFRDLEIEKYRNWEKVFEELDGKIAELEPKKDFEKLVYNIEIPKEGEYEIFIRDIAPSELKYAADAAKYIEIDGNMSRKAGRNTIEINRNTIETDRNTVEINRAKGEAGKDWMKFGERYFEEGEQELVLPFSGISENLVDENLRIKDYSPNSIYRISFDYQAPRGGSFFVAEGKTGETAETKLSSTGDEFRHFEMFFKSSLDAQEADVHLSISVSEEKNLRIERIYQPEVILRNIKHQASNIKHQTLQITFLKINPTKYKVKVEGAKEPYTLVFSESFHQGWKAYINKTQNSKLKTQNYGEIVASYFDGEIKEGTHKNIFLDKSTFETWGKKPLSEDKHLLVNGYANSWYITPEDANGSQDYEIIIEFAPQKLFYVGLFVSGLTLVGCLGYLIFDFFRKKWRKISK